MTEEEIAEEYADRTRVVDENTRAGTDCISLVQDYEGNYIDIHERIKQAFLAGLEAGKDMAETDLATVAYMQGAERYKPKWHKVADEGLPINKNDGATYLLYTIYGEGGSPVVAHFAYRDKQELMNVWTGAILTEDKIVAWKEIVLPKEIKEDDE